MYEVLPIVAGIVFAGGLLLWGPADQRARWIASAVFAVVVGFIAASVSGEISESWAFVLLDAAFCLVAVAVGLWLLPRFGLGENRRSL
jgi:hypothetical protein